MKKVRLLLPVVMFAMASGFYACQKDNTNSSISGNSNLGIKIQALNKSFSLPVTNTTLKSTEIANSSITWDTATMVVSSVKFEAELKSLIAHHDSIEIDYKWNGPQEINLFDSTISIGSLTLQPGFYDEIELKVQGLKEDAGDKPVFYLHGIYTNEAGISMPLSIMVNENVQFKTEKDSVEITAADPLFTSIIQLYLDKLLADVEISALDNATLTNGNILISAIVNEDLYNIIVRNLVKDHHCKHDKSHNHGDHH
jgi:hypothetical protein